jgi:L-aspartate oxidase
LINFDAANLPHRFVDLLIIGAGLAGLRAALESDPSLSVLVVTKDSLNLSSSSQAQGGIASVQDPEDRLEWHVQDTLRAGARLCHPDVVERVVAQAPDHIRQLIELGTRFDQRGEGLTLGREGGHSHHRIVHALGDATGQEVMRAVIDRVRALRHVEIVENAFTLDLLVVDERCRGALVALGPWRMMIWAKETILASGGAGQLYRESSNPRVATGDGHAMAYRAGVELRDMEFVQFHPTLLYIAGSSRTLITEAMRGEGAYLVDHAGHRFMPDYDQRAELAPRDVVSQAITAHMERTRQPCVYLTLAHLPAEHVRQRFPGIQRICAQFGIDITRDRIPVRPGAHYMIGGVTVDGDGRTSLEGLWAAGEVTSSGLHGANRLASNSLLEGLVYGRSAGAAASAAARQAPQQRAYAPLVNDEALPADPALDLTDIRNSLTNLMGRQVGVERDAAGLTEALDSVAAWQSYVLGQSFDSPAGWELQNLLTIAPVTIRAALRREESRGVHCRRDFPDTDDRNWLCHLAVRGEAWAKMPITASGSTA